MPKLLNKVTVATAVVAQVTLLGFLSQARLRATTFVLEEATITGINDAFDSGELTSETLVQQYLDRIDAYDKNGPQLNSIIALNPDALETAAKLDQERQLTGPRSALHGIPILLKDNYDTFDLPTTAGSVLLDGSIPPDDAFVVKQLRDAGAVILGKTNMSEWAWGIPPSLIGATLNPYKLNRSTTLGSSGGTGAAIAANFAVVGTGSDTGGSIRGPAAANSLVGIKPTLGLVSRDGIIPLALSFDTAGPIARTVTDAAITLGVMTGLDLNDPATLDSEGKFFKDYTQFLDKSALEGATIGVARDFFGFNPEVDEAVETAIAEMEALGATVVDIRFPEDVLAARGVFPDTDGVWPTITYTEFKVQIADYLATTAAEYPKTLDEIVALSASPEVANSKFPVSEITIETLFKPAQATAGLDSPEYIDAKRNGIPFIRNAVLNIMENNNLDALVYPSFGCPPEPLPGLRDPAYECTGNPYDPFFLANITGFPDIQVPAGFTEDGLPISVSFFGPAYSEPDLLGFAYTYEQATLNRRPAAIVPAFPVKPVPESVSTAAFMSVGLGKSLSKIDYSLELPGPHP